METQGKGEYRTKSEPGSHSSSGNGDGPGLVSAHESRSLDVETSDSTKIFHVAAGARGVERRQRGRPRKKEDTIAFWQFGRAARVMWAYDEARERGDKHSVAVRYAVDVLKRLNPEMRISETEVKRILATWRPRGSRTILRFQRTILGEEGIKKHRWILQQMAMLRGNNDLRLRELPNYDLPRDIAVFTMRFAERPNYPRHNRKNPKE